jgi:DNA-binding GntR family transcriptional regulator
VDSTLTPPRATTDELTLVERTRRELRRQLLLGHFPLWERLAEARLATQLGVSRTPVREALRLLEREDLVTVDENGSYRPRAPEVSHLRNLYQIRQQLEDLSMQLACAPERDDATLKALGQRWRAMEPPRDGEADPDFVFVEEDFHITLAASGGNDALVEVLASINDRIRLARRGGFLVPGQVADTIKEHLAILRIVERRETDRARDRMRRHIGDSALLVEESARQALARMLAGGPQRS